MYRANSCLARSPIAAELARDDARSRPPVTCICPREICSCHRQCVLRRAVGLSLGERPTACARCLMWLGKADLWQRGGGDCAASAAQGVASPRLAGGARQPLLGSSHSLFHSPRRALPLRLAYHLPRRATCPPRAPERGPRRSATPYHSASLTTCLAAPPARRALLSGARAAQRRLYHSASLTTCLAAPPALQAVIERPYGPDCANFSMAPARHQRLEIP